MSEAEERKIGERSDGRFRVNSSYSEEQFELLDKLAVACGVPIARLQKELTLLCLNDESAINFIQDQFKRRSRFRAVPSKLDGRMVLVLMEKKKTTRKGNG